MAAGCSAASVGRIAVFLGADLRLRPLLVRATCSSARSTRCSLPGDATDHGPHDRVTGTSVEDADWIGFPTAAPLRPTATWTSSARPELLADVHPARAAGRDRADRGERRSRQGRRRDDRRPTSTPTWAGRSAPTASAPRSPAPLAARRPRRTPRTSASWRATRVYSTAAYYVAAIIAILLGLCRSSARSSTRRRRRPGRDHARALRHDRPDRRQDLGGERRRLR